MTRRPGVGGAAGTLNALLVPFDDSYGWDKADNLTSITSLAGPSPMPSGRRQVRRTVAHDSLYRVAQVSMEYLQDDLTWGAYDSALDWRDERTRTNTGGSNHHDGDPMRSTPSPRIGPLPTNRIVDLQYEYDWLANQTRWEDDAASFFERSLGEIGNGADALLSAPQGSANALRPSALYLASNLRTSAAETNASGQGWLDVDYGASGNVLAMTVRASCTDVTTNSCVDDPTLPPAARETLLRSGCACAEQQLFQYRWDELNRLVEARRYDYRPSTNDWSLAARHRSRYDSGNMRTVKASLSPDASAGTTTERVHLYVYPGDFERAGTTVNRTDVYAPTYVGSGGLGTETEYHVAGTNIVWKPGTPNGTLQRRRRITFALRDMLGTASAVVDLESGHLLEMATFTPNGAREMHWTTDETSMRPERNAFTGKEEDEEVGVSYFGHRYLIARIGRWASPDPLSAHAMGGGEVSNAFHFVAGSQLQARDPDGLADVMIVPAFGLANTDRAHALSTTVGLNWQARDRQSRRLVYMGPDASETGIPSTFAPSRWREAWIPAFRSALASAGAGGRIILNTGHGNSGVFELSDGESSISARAVAIYSAPGERERISEQGKVDLARGMKIFQALEAHYSGGGSRLSRSEIHSLDRELDVARDSVRIAWEVDRYSALVDIFRSNNPGIEELYLTNCRVGRDATMLQQMANDLGVRITAHTSDVYQGPTGRGTGADGIGLAPSRLQVGELPADVTSSYEVSRTVSFDPSTSASASGRRSASESSRSEGGAR